MLRATLQRALILATLFLALGPGTILASETEPVADAQVGCPMAQPLPAPVMAPMPSCGATAPAASPCAPAASPCAPAPPPMANPCASPCAPAPPPVADSCAAPSPCAPPPAASPCAPSPCGPAIATGSLSAPISGYSAGPGLLVLASQMDPNPLWPADICGPWCYQWAVWARGGVSPFAVGSVAIPIVPTWSPAQVCGCAWPSK